MPAWMAMIPILCATMFVQLPCDAQPVGFHKRGHRESDISTPS
jgi:hypothetical protein